MSIKNLIKLSKQVSGIVEEQTIVNRHIIKFSNTQETLWKGNKKFAH